LLSFEAAMPVESAAMETEYKIIGADGREYGPATLEELRAWTREGRVGRRTLVWNPAAAVWTEAARLVELADLSGAMPDAADAQAAGVETAGFWLRFVAFWLDNMFIAAAVVLVAGLPTLPGADELKAEAILEWLKQIQPWLVTTAAAYKIFTTWRWGGTPGKRLLGMRVVRAADDSPVTLLDSALRFIGSMISEFLLMAGYLFAAFRGDRRTLHDLLAGTRVVRVR
jgi:uncharacterized RDD family membrane protein YckC